MTNGINEIGQPIRFAVEGWRERPRPPRAAMTGQHCALEPLQPGIHAADLYAAFQQDKAHRVWTYMPYGPFHIFEDYRRWLESSAAGEDPLFIARRMLILASEDVGNADPAGLTLATAAYQAVHAVGMPEARIRSITPLGSAPYPTRSPRQ